MKQQSSWPVPDPQALIPDFIEIPVSVNGKFFKVLKLPYDSTPETTEAAVDDVVYAAYPDAQIIERIIGATFANILTGRK